MDDKNFKCISSFETEGKICREGEIYTAYLTEYGYKIVFDNGEMNTSRRLFDDLMKKWIDQGLIEIKYKTKYSNVVPKGYIGKKIAEVRECGAIKLEFPNSEQYWFLYRELKEVPNE